MERVVFSRFGPVEQCDTRTHTVYLPLPAPRAPTVNYVIVKFSSFHFLSPPGASVSLLPAASLRTEAWFTGECLPVCLLVLTFSTCDQTGAHCEPRAKKRKKSANK